MKKLYSATQVIVKILEVCHWVGTAVMGVLFVLTLVPGDLYRSMVAWDGLGERAVRVYSLELEVIGADGQLDKAALRLFALGAVLILGLMAMVLRNAWLCLKTARGKTWFAKGETPFQTDVTRMIREMGIFLLATVAVALAFSVLARLVLGGEGAEAVVNFSWVVMGLLLLCLSQVFDQGTQLQQDVDGLL